MHTTLVVFDVDGTLTESGDVDAEVNLRAMAELFDIHGVDSDWSRYRHATDGGVFEECFARRWGRPATDAERARFERHVGQVMEEALRAAPHRAPAVAGAPTMLAALAARADVTLAIASGAYERSVLAKLRAAALNLGDLPRATGSDALSREEIVTLALRRAAARAGRGCTRVVSVGDGSWDVLTARRLDLAFVGVARDGARLRLEREGAAVIVGDYLDLTGFLRAAGLAGGGAGAGSRD